MPRVHFQKCLTLERRLSWTWAALSHGLGSRTKWKKGQSVKHKAVSSSSGPARAMERETLSQKIIQEGGRSGNWMGWGWVLVGDWVEGVGVMAGVGRAVAVVGEDGVSWTFAFIPLCLLNFRYNVTSCLLSPPPWLSCSDGLESHPSCLKLLSASYLKTARRKATTETVLYPQGGAPHPTDELQIHLTHHLPLPLHSKLTSYTTRPREFSQLLKQDWIRNLGNFLS